MNDEQKFKRIDILQWCLMVAAIVLLTVFFSGCKSEQKSMRKTQEYLFKHPDFSAGYCAEQYPVKAGGVDSSEYKLAIAGIDTLINQNDKLREQFKLSKEEFKKRLQEMKADTNANKEDMFVGIEHYIDDLEKQNDKLIKQNETLKRSVKTLPPVHDTVRDQAREHQLELMNNDCQKNNNVLQASYTTIEGDRDKWHGKARKRFWQNLFLLGVIVGFIALKIYQAVKPKVEVVKDKSSL